MSVAAKRHMARVAEFGQQCGCICCGEPFAHLHHILEGRTPGRKSGDFCVIPVCEPCHTGQGGIHDTRSRWVLRKTDELEALNRTLEAVYGRTR